MRDDDQFINASPYQLLLSLLFIFIFILWMVTMTAVKKKILQIVDLLWKKGPTFQILYIVELLTCKSADLHKFVGDLSEPCSQI